MSHSPATHDLPAAAELLESLPDAVYLVDPETSRILWGNREAWASLGMTKDQLLATDILSLQKDLTGIEQWRDIAATARTRGCFSFVGRHRHADGGEVEVEIRSTHLVQGQREYFLSVVRDIRRRNIEADLADRSASGQLWFALNEAGDGLWDWNIVTGETYYSPQLKRMLGYGPDEMEPSIEAWRRHVHPADLVRDQALLQDHLDGRSARYESEYRLRDRNGDYRWVRDRGRVCEHAPDGRPLRIVGTLQDITVARAAVETLHLRERYQRALLDNFPFMVWLKDRDSRILAANTAYAKVAGVESTDELVGRTDLDFWERELAERYRADDRAVLASGCPKIVEEEITESGRRFWIETFKSPVEVDGQVIGTVGFARDISERRMAEQRVRTLIETLPVGLIAAEAESRRFLFANATFCRMVGYDVSELAGLSPADMHPPKDLGRVLAAFDATARGALLTTSDLEVLRKDGSSFVAEVKSTHIVLDGRNTVAAVFTDITDRKRAEAALVESHNLLQTIIDTVPIRVFWKDRNSRLLGCNPLFAQDAGYRDPATIIGCSDDQMAWSAQADLYRADDARVIESGQSKLGFEEVQTTPDGGTIVLRTSKVPLRNTSGDIVGVLGIYDDITAQKLAERELERYRNHLEDEVEARTAALSIAKEAAETASRAKGTFLANMSHELRTPMTAIIGLTSLALSRANDPKLRDQLTKVDAASQHLLAVINDILDLSKIEADRLTIDRVPFVVGELIRGVAGLSGQKATAKGLGFFVQPGPAAEQLRLLGDPLRLGQVLLNLVANAVKFTDRGAITLSVTEEGTRDDAVVLRFSVEDTGIGLQPDEQARVFDAFEQADNSTTRKYGGTGLGLAISKRLVSLMGGQIGVLSTPGSGSTFWFSVPLTRAREAPDGSRSIEALDPLAILRTQYPGVRILLAEDEPINREVAVGMLEYAGLTVDLAVDGAEAVSRARAGKYDLILMDMQMPQMSGLDAARAIRGDSMNQTTPIIAMTANAFEEDRQRCLEAGMDDHLGKPVVTRVLYETLTHWLGETRQ